MSLPPAFTKSFYVKLAAFAREFKKTRAAFALQAIEHYASELRKKKSYPAKTLGSVELADKYKGLISKVSKDWWSKQSPEDKEARARKAAEARWGKAKKAEGSESD